MLYIIFLVKVKFNNNSNKIAKLTKFLKLRSLPDVEKRKMTEFRQFLLKFPDKFALKSFLK